MKKDTLVYSDFIKRNNIKVNRFDFSYKDNNGELVNHYIVKEGKYWYVDYGDEGYESKKSAIYWHIKNNIETLDGYIIYNK